MMGVKQSRLFKFRRGYLTCLVFIFLFVLTSAANAEEIEVLFEDNFNTPSDDVNRENWTSVEWTETYNPAFFGRTAIRNPKIPAEAMDSDWNLADNAVKVGTSAFNSGIGVAKLRLDRYNPIIPELGNDYTSFWGSEIDTGNGNNLNDFETYSLQNHPEGISFEARIRPSPYLLANPSAEIPGGMVTSVFAYGLRNEAGIRDEIDFEFLTNSEINNIHLNYYANTADGGGNPESVTVSGFNPKLFNTVKINWFTDKIEWCVNGTLIHTVNASDGANIPQGPMGLRINVWAPDDSWDDAYDELFQPVSDIAYNEAYIYEVDWAKVSVAPEPVSSLLFLLGSATLGLFGWKKKTSANK